MLRLERPATAAVLAFALHLPFVLRYDLNFQPDFAISTLMSRAIAFEGARPVFFWGQGYLGTWGCYVTAALFRLFGVSVPLAGLVALAIWAAGVALATALAGRLLGPRAAWWAALTAAVASPYANHYVTQPYSSYETAPVVTLLVVAGLAHAWRLTAAPLDGRVAARWLGLGLVLGAAWWTTRLFLPAVVAAALAVLACARWERVAVRRAAAGLALLALGAMGGDLPELLYAPAERAADATPSFRLNAPARVASGFRQAIRTLPAYLNGDPRAREPEGVRFAHALEAGMPLQPATGPLGRAHDALALAATIGLLALAVGMGLRALRDWDVALGALCLVPLVQLVLIALSAEANAEFYHARRYWFGSLLVLPVLAGGAVETLGRWRPAAARVAAGVLVYVLAASAIAQIRLLRLPDELADYRALVRQLTADGEEAVWMASWNAWVIAALSDGRLQAVSGYYNRRPGIEERVAAHERIVVVAAYPEQFPLDVQISRRRFVPAPEAERTEGRLRWRPYRRAA